MQKKLGSSARCVNRFCAKALHVLAMQLGFPDPIRRKATKMQKTLFALSLGFVGVILATHAGFAGPQDCGPRDAVLAQLAGKYAETRRSIGRAGDQAVMEVFASASTGTWTILVTLPNGASCLVASGDGFEAVVEDLPAKGDPA